MTKQQRISKHVKVMLKLYPDMDKRKVRRDAYLAFSVKWLKTWEGIRARRAENNK